jgi:hypothetical protein
VPDDGGRRVCIESFGVGLLAENLVLAADEDKREGAKNLLGGRKLLQKLLKKAKPVEIEIVTDGKR